MKKRNARKILGASMLLFSLPLLVGCNIFDLLNGFGGNTWGGGNNDEPLSRPVATDFNGYYQPKEVNGKCSFQSIGALNEDPYLPSNGKLKVLVMPIEFQEYPFSTATLKDIKTLTSGTSSQTEYWESVSSFYSKSSYGNLELEFVQMDKVNVGSVSSFTSGQRHNNNEGLLAGRALRKGVEAYKKANGADSTKDFDTDGDGYIDAVIMIYSAPDYTNSNLTARHPDLFWAYSYSDYENTDDPDPDSPIGWRYMWASYDFLYTATGTPSFHTGIDAHTVIHEMGHLFGSDDYYNAVRENNDIAEPSGSLMMMAWNVGDHDMFTKLSYGWVKPYVVEKDCTIMIRPSQESGDCILLADSWNGTAFDEYILIDYYTPTGLNQLDATTVYPSYEYTTNETSYRKSGIRVFHIDSRLVYGAGYGNEQRFLADGFLSDNEVANFDSFDHVSTYRGEEYLSAVTAANSNSIGYDSTLTYGKGYELIQLIQRGGRYTFANGAPSSSYDLFQKGDSFSLSSYSAFFPNRDRLNNGNALPFSFTIDDIGSDGAILTFKKS